MTLVTAPDNADAQHPDLQLTLSWQEAEHLRITLPWLLQALAVDRPTAAPRQRERRRKTHTILERLQIILSSQLQQTEQGGTSR